MASVASRLDEPQRARAPGGLAWHDPQRIERWAEECRRRKSSELDSATSMLTFDVNRNGRELERARIEPRLLLAPAPACPRMPASCSRELPPSPTGEERNASVRHGVLRAASAPGVALVFLLGCAAGTPSGWPIADEAGNTPLILAAARGEREKVTALLKEGADVNATNREGTSPLIAAAYGATGTGDVVIARALIASGANVNAATVHGGTALMAVAGTGNVEFVRLLLDSGADASARASDGETALHSAALNGHGDTLAALLANGARPNVSNSIGQTPLMLACYCPVVRQTCPQRPEMVRSLIASGAELNATDIRGQTALGWTIGGTKEERDAVRRLLEAAGATRPRT